MKRVPVIANLIRVAVAASLASPALAAAPALRLAAPRAVAGAPARAALGHAPTALSPMAAFAAPMAPASAMMTGPLAAPAAPAAAASPLSATAQAVAALPNLGKASAGDARGSGAALEQAMTGETSVMSRGAASILGRITGGDKAAAPAAPATALRKAGGDEKYQAGVTEELAAEVAAKKDWPAKVETEVRKVMVGLKDEIGAMMDVVISGESAMLRGVPGVAKTQLIKAVAKALGFTFGRVQGTPDLQPFDIVGSEVLEKDPNTGESKWKFVPGPIFANVVLFDEVNRMMPKTNSAQLQAKAEGQVTVGNKTYTLEQPFMGFGTMNPIEQEGTYRVPEAALDRDLYLIDINLATDEDEEMEIMRRFSTKEKQPEAQAVTTKEEYLEVRRLVERIWVDPALERYIAKIVIATRDPKVAGLEFPAETLKIGVSPRASIGMLKAARARAFREGRAWVSPADIRAVAPYVLNHRYNLGHKSAMEPEQWGAGAITKKILDAVKIPEAVGAPKAEVPVPSQDAGN